MDVRLILLTLMLAISSFSDETNTTYKREFIFSNMKVELEINESDFSLSGREIRIDKFGDVFIDGRLIYGTKDEKPEKIISHFIVKVNQKKVPIPDTLYNVCSSPDFNKQQIGSCLSNDSTSVFIFMNGGDGVAVYSVLWIIDLVKYNHKVLIKEFGDGLLFNLELIK